MNLQALTGLLAMLFVAGTASAQTTPPTNPDSTTVIVQGEKPGRPHNWLKAESPHFTVYSDTSRGHVRELLENMERFRYVLNTLSHIGEGPAGAPKFTLYYLADAEDLAIVNPEMPNRAAGLYEACEEG